MKSTIFPISFYINTVLARCFILFASFKDPTIDNQADLSDDLYKLANNPVHLILWIIETLCYILRKIAF